MERTRSEDTSFQGVSPEERIKELNAIDHDISLILDFASQALGQLPNENFPEPNPKLKDVRDKFEELTRNYYSTLSSVSVRLRRQVYGLEEAGLVNKGTKADADRAASMNENQSSRREGGGPLDSSWLNARAKDSTGRSMKQEVLEEAMQFLKKNNIDVPARSQDDMQIDP